jgi:hypothetical protein
MPKVAVRYMDYFAQTMRRMREDGLLLVTAGADGKPNAWRKLPAISPSQQSVPVQSMIYAFSPAPA